MRCTRRPLERRRIRTADGDDYYFARENLADAPFEHLQIGAQVRFIPEVAAQGRQAKRVTVEKQPRST